MPPSLTTSRCLPLAATGLVLLTGCAPLEWHKDGAAADAREGDFAACAAQARGEAQRAVPPQQPPQVVLDAQGRAIAVQPPRDDQRFLLEQDLLRQCMQARGYALRERETRKP
jgi:hypothetical protein